MHYGKVKLNQTIEMLRSVEHLCIGAMTAKFPIALFIHSTLFSTWTWGDASSSLGMNVFICYLRCRSWVSRLHRMSLRQVSLFQLSFRKLVRRNPNTTSRRNPSTHRNTYIFSTDEPIPSEYPKYNSGVFFSYNKYESHGGWRHWDTHSLVQLFR